MKIFSFTALLISFILCQETTSYSWEDGGTILGSYGNLSNPQNVGPTDGIEPYDGNYMLTVSESPVDGTPQAFIAWITDISSGDAITACFYGYDTSPNASPSLRIWGSWTSNDDINSYGGAVEGNTDYTDGTGWSEVCHTFTTNSPDSNGNINWDSGEGLVIQARLYSSSSGTPDPTIYYIDLVTVTAPTSATVTYPGSTGPATEPIADAGENQIIEPGNNVILDGSSSSDPDGTIDYYEWSQISGTAVILSDEESSITNFTAPDEAGELIFQLTVWDNDGNEDSDQVSIYVSGTTSIRDIQYTEEQGQYCYDSPMSGEIVSTFGVVTAVKPGTYPNFYLKQPGVGSWGGIYVYDTSVSPSIGDEITLSATVNEYYSFTQLIDVSSFTIESTGNSVNPISISCEQLGTDCSFEGEMLEGMLVSVHNVVVESVDEYDNWHVNDGSETILISDYFFDGNWPQVSGGETYGTITGVVEYSYSEFKILPRNINDMNELEYENQLFSPKEHMIISNYPNPFNPFTTIEVDIPHSGYTSIDIIDLNGNILNEVYNGFLDSNNPHYFIWDASNYSSGIYFTQVKLNNYIKKHKITLLK